MIIVIKIFALGVNDNTESGFNLKIILKRLNIVKNSYIGLVELVFIFQNIHFMPFLENFDE